MFKKVTKSVIHSSGQPAVHTFFEVKKNEGGYFKPNFQRRQQYFIHVL